MIATRELALKYHGYVSKTAEVFLNTMCDIELERLATNPGCDGDAIAGIISFTGQLNWSTFVAMPKETALTLVPAFAGFEIPYESEDMLDAIGELANILAGGVTLKLCATEDEPEISLPTVRRLDNIGDLSKLCKAVISMAFSSPHGTLWVGELGGFSADAA